MGTFHTVVINGPLARPDTRDERQTPMLTTILTLEGHV